MEKAAAGAGCMVIRKAVCRETTAAARNLVVERALLALSQKGKEKDLAGLLDTGFWARRFSYWLGLVI